MRQVAPPLNFCRDDAHRPQSRARRKSVRGWLALVGLSVAASGCAVDYNFHNVAAFVDSVGPVCVPGDPATADTRTWVLVSLVDYEADLVDLTVEWRATGSTASWSPVQWAEPSPDASGSTAKCGAQTLDPAWALRAGYGSTGYVTERATPGSLHVLVLDSSSWAASGAESIELRIAADDGQGDTDQALQTGAIAVAAGADEIWLP